LKEFTSNAVTPINTLAIMISGARRTRDQTGNYTYTV
jgi:hypothetical protein